MIKKVLGPKDRWVGLLRSMSDYCLAMVCVAALKILATEIEESSRAVIVIYMVCAFGYTYFMWQGLQRISIQRHDDVPL